LETLRLQGFPDDWFDGVEGYNNTAAYKATGNSVAVPCVEWVFERIIEFDKQQRGKK
jgi:DNA (cytosine-5)-methyltransferase 1